EVLAARGARASLVCTDVPPPLYDFLPGIGDYGTDPTPDRAYDLLVIVDCGSLDRVGAVRDRQAALFAALPTVVIDHHASNRAAGEADWVDPDAAATC
ncbi:MAG: bifunctional oligoribonuclease/PAP phosphatase NrnA, partial [Chloroflexi bacterium]|nr:bifunctional oligoribonuclease/PAP phosphatase NrnA [Chloroflexota bacterium]